MAMVGLDEAESTQENYRRFARLEAAGRSPTYAALATAVADAPDVLAYLSTLPPEKRQPNLLFAAARHITADIPTINTLRALVTMQAATLTQIMLTRRTQTNEPARCATLLPALASIPGPLAIIEVGASAGLCLHLNRYSYEYGTHHLHGTDPDAPTMSCRVIGGSPPLTMPNIVWAAGIDLNPLDPTDPDDQSWLQCLVWPDQPQRATRLRAALNVAARHPIPVHTGDLVEQLPSLLQQAPPGATVVVFHSAVLAYLDPGRRAEFADLMETLDAMWIANEAPGIVADNAMPYDTAAFVLTVNRTPVAHTDPHGAWIDWHGPTH